MERNDSTNKQNIFAEALQGKNIPILTLDNKWYRLLDKVGRERVSTLEEQLNTLLKRQGKLNTEIKSIKKLKKKLMSEIVPMVDEVAQGKRELNEKIEEHKRLIQECNDTVNAYEDELLGIPKEITRINKELMLLTMEHCYQTMHDNTQEIQEISDWVTEIRVELKKRLIWKQEMEWRNNEIYSYMHDIFGAEIVNLFDMKYHPEIKQQKKTEQNDKKEST